jgi:hypothetical protein
MKTGNRLRRLVGRGRRKIKISRPADPVGRMILQWFICFDPVTENFEQFHVTNLHEQWTMDNGQWTIPSDQMRSFDRSWFIVHCSDP